MDMRPPDAWQTPGSSRLSLRVGTGRFPILTQTEESCLIFAPGVPRLRGYADIYEGEIHRARCLLVLSEPEGGFIRLTWKRYTPVLAAPPTDYAPD
jgi:hypothetical protein